MGEQKEEKGKESNAEENLEEVKVREPHEYIMCIIEEAHTSILITIRV